MCAMLLKSNRLPSLLGFCVLFLLGCSKPKDHLDIINPYANQVRQISYFEYKSNLYNQNIYPFKALGIQFVNPDSLSPGESCIVDGTDTLNYKEFETEGEHHFVVVNSNGDTLQTGYLYLSNTVTRVFFPTTVIPLNKGNEYTEVWKPTRIKAPNIPPFYSEHYEIRDFALNKIFSADSFDSTWTAKRSLGPYYYYAQYVDWYGKVYEAKGEIISIQ